jgi:hypothetical protein
MSEEEIIQEIEKLDIEEEKEKVIKNLLRIVIEGKKDIIQEKEIFLKKKEQDIEELKAENEELINQRWENDKLKKEIERLKEKQDYARLEKEQLLGNSISKDKIREIKNKNIGQYMNFYREIEELLEE